MKEELVEARNCAVVVEYDGSGYLGWQIQREGQITVQEVLENALFQITGERVRVVGSGRTDTGVHAFGQVAHFLIRTSLSTEKLLGALNYYLPKDVVVRRVSWVPKEFHARFSAKKKCYQYTIWNHSISSPLRSRHSYWFRFSLDREKLREASACLVGTHDFSAFASKKEPSKSGVRTLFRADWKEREEDLLVFEVEGSGFLYNMVRSLVGTLLQVGTGKISGEEFKEILESKDRKRAGMTAPPEGLCLVWVDYGEDF